MVVIFAFYRYCVHKSVSYGHKSTPNENVTSLVFFFILAVVASGAIFVHQQITRKLDFPIDLLAAIILPFMLIVHTLIINIRKVSIIIGAGRGHYMFESLATNGRSYGATNTNFTLPDDEWD